jgi:hypothetical protein
MTESFNPENLKIIKCAEFGEDLSNYVFTPSYTEITPENHLTVFGEEKQTWRMVGVGRAYIVSEKLVAVYSNHSINPYTDTGRLYKLSDMNIALDPGNDTSYGLTLLKDNRGDVYWRLSKRHGDNIEVSTTRIALGDDIPPISKFEFSKRSTKCEHIALK